MYVNEKKFRKISNNFRKSGRPFTIAVEGNVGSGKSTLIGQFRNQQR
jgi:pantothenate kinase-related protein Tda10